MIKENPKNGPAYVVLAETLLERGRTEQAYKVSLEGVRNAPRVAGNYRNLAVHYAVRGDMKNYVDYSRSWAELETNPQYKGAAELNYLQALMQSGNESEAFEVALRTNSDNPEVQAAANAIVEQVQKKKSKSR
jgi:tetratricopeptide (TPR) repeat protein